MSDDFSVEEIIDRLKTKFHLSKAHAEYYTQDIEALEDLPDDARDDEIKAIEKDIERSEYLLSERVGSGAFGSVYRGIRVKDNMECAIKIIDLEETKDDISSIQKEITALVNAQSCPQLVSYYGSVIYGHKVWIAMEYVDGGSVLDKIKKDRSGMDEKQIAFIAHEVLLGLAYLSLYGRIHRDIKAANILLSRNGGVKLGDFGATGVLTDTKKQATTFVGSPYWMAPEIMTDEKYDGKADVWSLGITCLEMTTGKPPLSEVTPQRVMMVIPQREPPKADSSKYSANFCDFVAACLTKDPKKRPSVKDLLKHPFVSHLNDRDGDRDRDRDRDDRDRDDRDDRDD
jgi:serine/threonine-protein kinase 24/25/MST4